MIDIDDTIKHARTKARSLRKKEQYECADEHDQIADWLEELVHLRNEIMVIDEMVCELKDSCERETVEVWNQGSADDITCSEVKR